VKCEKRVDKSKQTQRSQKEFMDTDFGVDQFFTIFDKEMGMSASAFLDNGDQQWSMVAGKGKGKHSGKPGPVQNAKGQRTTGRFATTEPRRHL
jgi:hypothetical protein